MSAIQQLMLAGSSLPPPTNSTWNPSDKGANVTLSGGNLTAVKNGSGYESVRGTESKISQRRYFEVTAVAASGSSINLMVGVADSAFTLTGRYLGENNAGAKKSAGRYSNATFYRNLNNAASNAPTTAISAGTIVGIDIDFSASVMRLYDGATGSLLATFSDTGA